MKYYANGFVYTLWQKMPNYDAYIFIRPGGFIIARRYYDLVVEGAL